MKDIYILATHRGMCGLCDAFMRVSAVPFRQVGELHPL